MLLNAKDLRYIINFLKKEIYRKEGWENFLRTVSKIFSSQKAFMAIFEEDRVVKCLGIDKNDFLMEKDSDSIAYASFKEKKSIFVYDYPASQYAAKYWVDYEVKSVLATPVVYGNSVFAVLELVYDNKKDITKEEIDAFESLALIVGSFLYGSRIQRQCNNVVNINNKMLNFIYSIRIPSIYKGDEFEEWLEKILYNLSSIIGCVAIGFTYLDEDIYSTYFNLKDRKEFYITYEANDVVKDLIAYKMCQKNIKKVLLIEDLKDVGIEPSNPLKNRNIKSSIFLPVVMDNKTVAAFGIGFNDKNALTKEYQHILSSFAYYVILSIIASKNISKAYSILSETEEKFLESLVLMMEARDTYTKGHSQRVAYYAKSMAKSLGMDERKQNDIYLAGIVHDIGKIGIPDNVLLKPGRLTKNEFRIMQYHPVFSYEIVKNIKQFKGDIALCVKYHHERCDGSGYPDGLKCNEIPLCAKILAIADVFDAVTSSRPYRSKMSLDEAIKLLLNPKNKLDLDIVKRVADTLRDVFIEENNDERCFMPKVIDDIRKDIFTKDYVTGLMRRKQFVNLVNAAIAKKEVFTMFLVDIVELDYINYKHSMNTGDKIISYVAKALSKLDNVSYISRIGSDSFIFISKTYDDCNKDNLKNKIKVLLRNQIELDIECKSKRFDMDIIDFYISCAKFNPDSNDNADSLIYKCKLDKKRQASYSILTNKS